VTGPGRPTRISDPAGDLAAIAASWDFIGVSRDTVPHEGGPRTVINFGKCRAIQRLLEGTTSS
jgi:hypothetical protein